MIVRFIPMDRGVVVEALEALEAFQAVVDGHVPVGLVGAFQVVPVRVLTQPGAWLNQRPDLFQDSLRDNLRLADPDADDAALWQALEAAGLAAAIRRLQAGLDTRLGEGGLGLSAGQTRRLALARLEFVINNNIGIHPRAILDYPAVVQRTIDAQIRHAKLALDPEQLKSVEDTPELEWRLARREAFDSLSALVQATQRSLSEPRAVRPPIEALQYMQVHCYQLLAQLSAVKALLVLRRDRLNLPEATAALENAIERIERKLGSLPIAPLNDSTAASTLSDQVILPDPFETEITPWLLRRLDASTNIAIQIRDDASRVLQILDWSAAGLSHPKPRHLILSARPSCVKLSPAKSSPLTRTVCVPSASLRPGTSTGLLPSVRMLTSRGLSWLSASTSRRLNEPSVNAWKISDARASMGPWRVWRKRSMDHCSSTKAARMLAR